MKIVNLVLRIVLGLFLLMPVGGALGLFPDPTPEMYTPAGWAFMSAFMAAGYMMPLIGVVCLICSILFLTGRTALGAVVLAPFTVNVMLFHLFLDTGVFTATAIPADVLLFLNVFFLWENHDKYKPLLS